MLLRGLIFCILRPETFHIIYEALANAMQKTRKLMEKSRILFMKQHECK